MFLSGDASWSLSDAILKGFFHVFRRFQPDFLLGFGGGFSEFALSTYAIA